MADLTFHRWLQGAALLLGLTLPTAVAAQDLNTLNLDFHQGPLVSSGRVIGLGGAYVSVAEGADGHLVNPVAFGLRFPHDADDVWAWDIALSTVDALGSDSNDLDLSGRKAYDEAQIMQIGFNVKYKRVGVGFHAFAQNYILSIPDEAGFVTRYEYDQSFAILGAAYNSREGQLIFGGGILGGTATLSELGQGSLEMVGGGFQLGVLWCPEDTRLRFGASLRSPIFLTQEESDTFKGQRVTDLGNLRVPSSVIVPGELALGGSVMFGPRRYNLKPTWGDWYIRGEDKPARLLERRYLLVSVDVVMTGAADNAIGVQDFLAQDPGRFSGEGPDVGLRAGLESEFWANRMVARVGSYYEPSRFDDVEGRVHLTGGFDLRFTVWWDFKLNLMFDYSRDYENFGLGLGFWH